MYNNELSHHGVMGMKWGVRRYRNSDGTLTTKGKARFKEVEGNSRKARRDTRAALSVYKKQRNSYRPALNRDYYTNKAKKAHENGEIEKSKKFESMAAKYDAMDKALTKKMNDIKDGTIKAGRDFIIQRDYDFGLMTVNKTTQIIYK